ncbi:MAG: hypothetical protein IPP66_18045 [Anaerolineales bacterium]|nr:hypothetical protein [Anaerolineales bacterium]
MYPKRIVIDGKTYNSVDEMPPDIRQKYEEAMRTFQGDTVSQVGNITADNNNNSLSDVFESMPSGKIVANIMKFIVDGSEYKSLDDLPPEARAKYQQAMEQLDKNQNGIPDMLEGMTTNAAPNVQSTPAMTSFPSFPVASSKPIAPISSAMDEPEGSSGWMLVLVGVLLIGVCVVGAAGVWYFFLR